MGVAGKACVGAFLAAALILTPGAAGATSFDLGNAANFVLLGDNATNLVGNSSEVSGNIGVGPGGSLTLSGNILVNGSIIFADAISGSNYTTSGTNTITDGPAFQNAALVNSALDALCNHTNSETGACGAGSVYSTAYGVYNAAAATTTLNATSTLTAGDYNYANVDLNGDTITFSGSSSDYIIINVKNELKINHSSFTLTGGISADHILWNLIRGTEGGDATKNLTIGGAKTEFAGVFLALDRKIALSDTCSPDPNNPNNRYIAGCDDTGRIFGGNSGGSDDFRFVSGGNITAPLNFSTASTPEPASLVLLATGLLVAASRIRRFRRR